MLAASTYGISLSAYNYYKYMNEWCNSTPTGTPGGSSVNDRNSVMTELCSVLTILYIGLL